MRVQQVFLQPYILACCSFLHSPVTIFICCYSIWDFSKYTVELRGSRFFLYTCSKHTNSLNVLANNFSRTVKNVLNRALPSCASVMHSALWGLNPIISTELIPAEVPCTWSSLQDWDFIKKKKEKSHNSYCTWTTLFSTATCGSCSQPLCHHEEQISTDRTCLLGCSLSFVVPDQQLLDANPTHALSSSNCLWFAHFDSKSTKSRCIFIKSHTFPPTNSYVYEMHQLSISQPCWWNGS